MKSDDEIIADVIAREGDFVNDPNDPGGPTRWGITRRTLAQYRNRDVTITEIEHLTVNEAKEIYRALYLVGPGIVTILDPSLRALVLDSAVNHGPTKAIRMLQEAAGVKVDGIFGPQTRKAVNGAAAGKLWLKMMAERVSVYGRIITDNPAQAKFAAGWMNRMKGLLLDFAG